MCRSTVLTVLISRRYGKLFETRDLVIKEFMVNSPDRTPKGIFLMAHGAGRGMANPFMETIAKGLTQSGVRVVRFHFPYMERMVRTGEKVRPDGGRVLRQCFAEVIEHCIHVERCPPSQLIIGGKSMGGRIATLLADEHDVAGVICLGYPFHPPRQPNRWRVEQLQQLRTPTLICQGELDPFGKREEVERQTLSAAVRLVWMPGGDHNFACGIAGREDDNLGLAVRAANEFIGDLISR